VQKLTVI